MASAWALVRRFAVRIRTQAILLSVVPLTFLVALFVIASILRSETEQTAAWSQRASNALKQSDQLQKTIGAANRGVVDYTTKNHRPAALGPYRAALRDLGPQVVELRRLVRDQPSQEVRAARLGALSADVMDLLSQYLALWDAGKKAQAPAMLQQPRNRKTVSDWLLAKSAFDDAERANTIGRFTDLQREVVLLNRILLAASIAGILLTLFVTAMFGLRIARRLQRLAQNAQGLGEGQQAAVIGGSDEIADLDRVYHEMTQRIRDTLLQKDEALAAYERAHHVATTLQRALLPQELPQVAGIVFDAVYEPAKSEAQVGGDWYDALRLADGRVLISIGDVAGSGLQAAVIMAAMREVIRGVAQVYADPATIIDAADRTLKTEHLDSVVTAFVGVFDPVARTLAYVSAGHPPPLVRAPDGTVTDLRSRGLPLGIRLRNDADACTAAIPAGATVVFYTDGLIESTKDVIAGERTLRAALADPSAVARPQVAQTLYDRVLHDGTHDDVAILAMRVDAGSAGASSEAVGQEHHRWTFDTGDHATAQRSRLLFASILADGGMCEEDVFTAELIFGELLSNAVRYAPGPVEVVLDRSGDSIAVLHFLDLGPGFTVIPRLPSDLLSERGRGLFLVWSLAEELNVTKRIDGGSHARVVLTARRARKRGRSRRPKVAQSATDTG